MYTQWVDTITAILMLVEMNRREKAQEFDRKDSLAHFKAAFFHPENEIYLDTEFRETSAERKKTSPH